MSEPRAVVIPFGVPTESKGLGLGLAALVHAFVQVDGGGVALAQLQSRRREEQDPEARGPSRSPVPRASPASPASSASSASLGSPAALASVVPPSTAPVEAFVLPATWREIVGRGEMPSAGSVVLTGSFEPPGDGQGTLRFLAFDSRDGRTRARVEALFDEERAGDAFVGALEQIWSSVGGQLGALQGLRDLPWEALESVLRAERCVLHDPARGGPHDRLAAMLHLGRAIEDAPASRYAVERLAAIGLEAAAAPALTATLASASVRALERASTDAPARVELVESLAALFLRTGRPQDAERRLNEAVVLSPGRSSAYVLLARALRAQGRLDGALAALQAGVDAGGRDPALDAERAHVLAERGDLDGAADAWRLALARDPVHPVAFANLAAMALQRRDAREAQWLVDAAFAAARAHLEVLRSTVPLIFFSEPEGLARAARLARLCERILELSPDDAGASLVFARAHLALGEPAAARARLAQVRRVAPTSSAAAEAQTLSLAVEDPRADLEIQSVFRAARVASPGELADVAARARRLATQHAAWPGWLAAGIAEGRQARWGAARSALELALEAAPGAAPAHAELASVLLELEPPDPAGAQAHAERAIALAGATPQILRILARALAAQGRVGEARAVTARAEGAGVLDGSALGMWAPGLVTPTRDALTLPVDRRPDIPRTASPSPASPRPARPPLRARIEGLIERTWGRWIRRRRA